MIIRAASSDEEDDHLAFPADAASRDHHPTFGGSSASLSASTAVKAAWLGVSLAMVALLLVDLAALMTHVADGDAMYSQRFDAFSVFSVILQVLRGGGASVASSASTANNVLGQLFICAWIYSRESSMATQRARQSERARRRWPAALMSRNLHWLVIVGVLALGNIASCVYILHALFESNGNNIRAKFWLGRSSVGSRTAPRV